MTNPATAVPLISPQRELLRQECGFRKWRVCVATEVFYVVIGKAEDEPRARWYLSFDGNHWTAVSREELWRHLA